MKVSAISPLFRVITAGTMLLMFGCGGGGGSSSPPPKAIISYTIANSTSAVVKGLQFSTFLPEGVEIPLEPGTHFIKSTNLVAGSALSGLQMQAFATYSAPIRKVKMVLAPSNPGSLQAGFVRGECIKLTCEITSGVNLAIADFNNVNNGFPITDFTAYNYSANQQPENITNALTIAVNAILN